MNNSKKATLTTLAALVIAGSMAMLAGCQTVKGAGQDLQNASDATEKAITGEKK
jgi:predicted small secreted protein